MQARRGPPAWWGALSVAAAACGVLSGACLWDEFFVRPLNTTEDWPWLAFILTLVVAHGVFSLGRLQARRGAGP
jgi:hypothetical protein